MHLRRFLSRDCWPEFVQIDIAAIDDKTTNLQMEMRAGFADVRKDIKALSSRFDHAQPDYYEHKVEANERPDRLEQITGSEAPTRS